MQMPIRSEVVKRGHVHLKMELFISPRNFLVVRVDSSLGTTPRLWKGENREQKPTS